MPPCSVQNFNSIRQTQWMLKTNEFARDLSLKTSFRLIPYIATTPGRGSVPDVLFTRTLRSLPGRLESITCVIPCESGTMSANIQNVSWNMHTILFYLVVFFFVVVIVSTKGEMLRCQLCRYFSGGAFMTISGAISDDKAGIITIPNF